MAQEPAFFSNWKVLGVFAPGKVGDEGWCVSLFFCDFRVAGQMKGSLFRLEPFNLGVGSSCLFSPSPGISYR